MSNLKIGWAEADITPIPAIAKKVSLIGQFNERITDKVRDPIRAVVMVMDAGCGDGVAAVVSIDLCFVTVDMISAVRRALSAKLPDFPAEALILAATHIHTGPYIDDGLSLWGDRFSFNCSDPEVLRPEQYLEFLADRVSAAVAEAWEKRAPGGLAFKVGRIAVPQNRRVMYKNGTAVMYGKTDTPDFLRVEGMADNGVEYVIAYDKTGGLTGVMINMACPAQVIEHSMFISADLWGAVRAQWRECPFILPLCSAAGDITMRDLVRRYRMEKPMFGEEGMDEQAGRIVRESQYVLSTVTSDDIRYDPPVRHLKRDIMLPLWTVTEEQFKNASQQYQAFNYEYNENSLADKSPDSIPLLGRDRVAYSICAGVVGRHELQQTVNNVKMELHALRIGDSVLVNNAFELYQDFGMQIKARSISPQTIIAQLSCGNMGYLPTETAIAGGSYSTGVSNGYVGPEGGDILVSKTLDAITDVFAEAE